MNQVEAFQEHLEDQKTIVDLNNIKILNSKFQKHVKKTSANHSNDGVSK